MATAMHLRSHQVLFYKYCRTADDDGAALDRLVAQQKVLCERLGLLGRLLISSGGVNGALCCAGCGGDSESRVCAINEYIASMDAAPRFVGIDWKRSSSVPPAHHPFFLELAVRRVNEIVATNHAAVQLAQDGSIAAGGRHLTPAEWHARLVAADPSTVVVDVRNTFEHAIGRFETSAGVAAIEPGMQAFTEFERWADGAAAALKEKKVLMFCTGGVRCEKASAMLKSRGVADVSQLSGGIHRYLEQYPSERGGLFRGRNFVFDHRVSTPSTSSSLSALAEPGRAPVNASVVVGRCVAAGCGAPYDSISGARVCAVCRDFVLVCNGCVPTLRELHCAAHQYLRDSFFVLIDDFTAEELDAFAETLAVIVAVAPGGALGAAGGAAVPSAVSANKSVSVLVIPRIYRDDRRRVRKHIARLRARAAELRAGSASVVATWRGDTVDWSRRCHSCGVAAEACAAQRAGPLTRCAARRPAGSCGGVVKTKRAPWVKPPRKGKKKQKKQKKRSRGGEAGASVEQEHGTV